MYNGVGRQEEYRVGGGGEWAIRGRLYLPIGLFGVAISPRGANNRTRKA